MLVYHGKDIPTGGFIGAGGIVVCVVVHLAFPSIRRNIVVGR